MPVSARPELIAPAGDWECARAALANGADAIYFGLGRFNARMRADNFSDDDLPELVRFAHSRGARALAVFNVLVFPGELPEAEALLTTLARAGVDAVIVQDLGLATLARHVAPDLALHASTQMTLTSPESLAFAARLGVRRAVLARELSLRDLAHFHPATGPALEVFVHGALCVAYSGQCLTSEALGQRSANRGECAQACRLPYRLLVDGSPRDLGDRRYLLSPQDLAAIDEIPRLIDAGVAAFKIEGRLKSPEYVASVTAAYRRAIDDALHGQPKPAPPDERYRLEMAFSRGLFTGWIRGVDHQRLVHGRYGKKRGAFAGRVLAVGRDWVDVDLACPVHPGDGVVFDTGGDTDREQGGRVYDVCGQRLGFERGKIDPARIPRGSRVWKTSDPKLDRALRATFRADPPPRPRAVDFVATGRPGAPLMVEAVCGGVTARAASETPLQPARNRPLTPDFLRAQLGRLGGTPYQLASAALHLPEPAMLPVAGLNRLRRQLVSQLDAATPLPHPTPHSPRPALHTLLAQLQALRDAAPPPGPPQLCALCRDLPQMRAAAAEGIARIYLDFEDIRRYADALRELRDLAPSTRALLATPRIQKPGEVGFFKLILRSRPDGVLIRNLGAIDFFRDGPLERVGDFSLNCANPLTARTLVDAGLHRLTVSYDLNADQVADLARAAPADWFEMSIHQHMPLFHMEHCVFAAFLSDGHDATDCGRPCDGHDATDCGRPCDRHAVHLEDRVGARHPVKADVGCRNTVFHARAQSGARHYATFAAAGLRHFRVELLDESHDEAREILRAYRALLDGSATPESVPARLRAVDQLGVIGGTLTVLDRRPQQ